MYFKFLELQLYLRLNRDFLEEFGGKLGRLFLLPSQIVCIVYIVQSRISSFIHLPTLSIHKRPHKVAFNINLSSLQKATWKQWFVTLKKVFWKLWKTTYQIAPSYDNTFCYGHWAHQKCIFVSLYPANAMDLTT